MSFDYGSAEPQFMGGSSGSYLGKGRHVVQVDAYETIDVNGHPMHSIDVSNGEGIQRIKLHVTSGTVGRIVGFIDSVGLDRPKAGEFDAETGALSDAFLNRTLGKSLVIYCVEKPGYKDPDRLFSEVESFDRAKGGSDVTSSSDVGQAYAASVDQDQSVPF